MTASASRLRIHTWLLRPVSDVSLFLFFKLPINQWQPVLPDPHSYLMVVVVVVAVEPTADSDPVVPKKINIPRKIFLIVQRYFLLL
jgi:hypothetical protein